MHEDFAYTTLVGICYDVEKGFQFDLASVPRILWNIYPPQGAGPRADYGRAAAIHDRLCRYEVEHGILTWDQAADIWGEMLKACGVTAWNRFWLYRGVKWFGYICRIPAAFSAPVKSRLVTPVMHIRFRRR
jgi:hypothetical protein